MATSQPILPPVSEIYASRDVTRDGPVARAFSTLFEPSSALFEFLVPSAVATIANPGNRFPRHTYHTLIEIAISEIHGWPHEQQANFLGGHPRIGEVRGLSALSASEQAAHATPPEVLARLSELNEEYERRYPGLRYITFVNGRSRKMIMLEMVEKLGMGGDDEGDDEKEIVYRVGSDEWISEVRRALRDIGDIAKSRLAALKMDGDQEADD
jgi:2-oxo-4-hydroxy-4-carboxy--5-ureidoimidazoline (OHCU) decarboxylase